MNRDEAGAQAKQLGLFWTETNRKLASRKPSPIHFSHFREQSQPPSDLSQKSESHLTPPFPSLPSSPILGTTEAAPPILRPTLC